MRARVDGMTGKFVTIEGCEGVGKSTLVDGLKKYFAQKGVDAVFTREPGGTPAAEKIRAIILDAGNSSVTPVTELLLYAAARAQHTEELIKTAVNAGKVVVCDRYSDSTLAYQGYARGLDKDLCRRLNEIAQSGISPDITLFLDLSPEDGFARKGGADLTDRLESAGISFHEKVYEGFKAIAAEEPNRYVCLDASKSKEEVLADAIDALKDRGIIE